MVAPMQSGVAEAIDGVLNTFGPFVVPVALFAAGVVGYLFLVTIGRAGVEDDAPANDAGRSSDEGDERGSRGREAPSRDVDDDSDEA